MIIAPDNAEQKQFAIVNFAIAVAVATRFSAL